MLEIDLSGRTVLVTGATGELGRVMVRTLAQAGAAVAIHYHSSQARAASLKDELEKMGARAHVVPADVTDANSVEAMRSAVVDELGSPDIVVANAVIQYDWTKVLEQDIADYESQFRSCVVHAVLLAQAFVPGMIEKGWGRMIGINTECSMQYWEKQSAYISGKRGMDGLMRVLAREVGMHGITVNQVAPGYTISENKPDEETPEWYREAVPLKRRGTAQEIANVVAFLASDLSSFITGAFIPVCGGNVMPAI